MTALAEKHQLILPEFQIEVPGQDVPAHLRRFVGIWFSRNRGTRRSRQEEQTLIITSVDQSGKSGRVFCLRSCNSKIY